ncbi:MAG: nucleotidyltransferase domain-containing protein [Actinobacteria bacterium]|nr:nucleotidyltransferase domain-containing protein [Actinomycetota bacterium]MCL5882888.1 nucleotidyltransferase domain-containing protein [Actinomycetota bacterium]
MNFLDTINKRELEKICEKFSIRKLSVFGSAARADFGVDSDIDVLVEFRPGKSPSLGKFVDLQDELSDFLGRKVEATTVSIMNNPYRKREIEKDVKELYAA